MPLLSTLKKRRAIQQADIEREPEAYLFSETASSDTPARFGIAFRAIPKRDAWKKIQDIKVRDLPWNLRLHIFLYLLGCSEEDLETMRLGEFYGAIGPDMKNKPTKS